MITSYRFVLNCENLAAAHKVRQKLRDAGVVFQPGEFGNVGTLVQSTRPEEFWFSGTSEKPIPKIKGLRVFREEPEEQELETSFDDLPITPRVYPDFTTTSDDRAALALAA